MLWSLPTAILSTRAYVLFFTRKISLDSNCRNVFDILNGKWVNSLFQTFIYLKFSKTERKIERKQQLSFILTVSQIWIFFFFNSCGYIRDYIHVAISQLVKEGIITPFLQNQMMQPGKKLFPKNLSFKNKCRLLKPSNTLKLFFQLIQTLFNPLKKKKRETGNKAQTKHIFQKHWEVQWECFCFWLAYSIYPCSSWSSWEKTKQFC